jgi:hypothetical protein
MDNPFLIDIEDKEEYTIDDYINIHKQLKEKDIEPLLREMYSYKNSFYEYDDFKGRCTTGLRQKLIDERDQNLPEKKLYKIGEADDSENNKNCIVCCTPFARENTEFDKNIDSKSRYIASQQIINSLEEVGYNGHFYLFNGGFPNPTGKEMKYVGVPYCFKIFMMLEAKKVGFEKVVWIDSGCYAINNLQRLFDILEYQETLFLSLNGNNNYDAMVFQSTINLLNLITDTNLHDASYVLTIVFGLNMKSEMIGRVIEEYYEMVEFGLPFLSIFPEEIVLTALFNKPEYRDLIYYTAESTRLQIHEKDKPMELAKMEGYYFLHRKYKESS